MTMISIRLSLVGAQVGCRTKTSLPRTFSLISTITSPSEKRPTVILPRDISRWLTTSTASRVLAVPVKIMKLSFAMMDDAMVVVRH
ncbi:hypothetical protein D3C77_574170 [compost metagenome]